MKNYLSNTWDKLPDLVKTIITIVLVIIVLTVVVKIIQAVKQHKTDQYKNLPDINNPNDNYRDPRPLVDNIYNKLNGYNFNVYPEVVNLLTRMSDRELQDAYDYFQREYGAATGMSLTEFIDAEWDGGHYAPAIEKLKRKGLL